MYSSYIQTITVGQIKAFIPKAEGKDAVFSDPHLQKCFDTFRDSYCFLQSTINSTIHSVSMKLSFNTMNCPLCSISFSVNTQLKRKMSVIVVPFISRIICY